MINIQEHFDVKKQQGNKYQCVCPAHDDKQASLSITVEDDKILLNCFAGCSFDNIINSVNLKKSDLFKDNKPVEKEKKKLVKTYIYTDEKGNPAHYVNRYEPKSFSQGKIVDNKKIAGLKDATLYPYNLVNVINSNYVIIVEGEKDADNLIKYGFVATTTVGGANNFKPEYNKYFVNKEIFIIPDNDVSGKKYATDIKHLLHNDNVKIFYLPELEDKQDVSDFIEKFGINRFRDEFEKFKKLQVIVADVKEKKNIAQIVSYIYQDGKLIDAYVLDILFEEYNIKTSIFRGKRKYFFYENGYWKETDRDSLGVLIYAYLSPTDRKARTINNILSLIVSDKRFIAEEQIWNAKHRIINLNNCAFDLDRMIPIAHSPELYQTYKNTYNFDANATCPTFDKVLQQYSCGNNDWIDRLLEIMGYCLFGDMPLQKMFWFMGNGRNGKGTIIRIIEALVGLFLTVAGIDSRDLRDKFYLTNFVGKRLATAGDIPPRLANVSLLKSLTGGDKQTTDVKFGDAITFTNNAKIIFAMNQVPVLPDNESIKPVAKRIVPLYFNYEITEIDTELEGKLLSELSGIFNKVVIAVKRMMLKGEFSPVKDADLWLKNWSEKKPPLQEFLEQYEYSEDADGEFLHRIFKNYENMMFEFFGKNWENDYSVYVKGSRRLKEVLIDDFMKRYKVNLEFTRKYDSGEMGTMTFIKNIRYKFNNDN